MYSKKINELATNLNPQETDLIPIGDAVTGQLKTTTYSSISGITGDGVISGGIVTWTGTGLNFNISACTYILNGIRYTSPLTTKTLAAADPTNPRIDVFAVNTSGQVEVIQGTPNINPVEPEGDTPTTLGLTNVTIAAGATTPSGVTRDLIYDENVESWTKGQSVTGTYNYADTAFAYTGSKSLLVQMSAGYAYFLFSKATAMDISNYKSLSFAIRLNTAWTNNTILSVQFYNSTNLITNTYQLGATNTVGFNRNLANTWQLIIIPLNGTLLKFNQNSFTGVRIFTTNAAATYRLDTIQLNSGISNPTGGGTSSANSFGFVNGSTGTASSTTATDTLTVFGTGLATTSASGKTLTIAVPLNLTTTGTSGAATLVGNTLNIPQYEAEGNYITGNGTSGQVSYWNGTTSQAGSNNLFWDATNNRLGIGTNAPSYTLDIPAHSTSNIQHRVGSFQIQSFALNNVLISDNTFYNGTAYTRTTTGFASTLSLYNGQALFYGAASGTGTYTQNVKFKFDYEGAFVIGNNLNIAQGNYTGATALFTKNGRLLLGTTSEGTNILEVNGNSNLTGTLSVSSTATFGTYASGTGLRWDNTNNRLSIGDGTTITTANQTIVAATTIVGIAVRNISTSSGNTQSGFYAENNTGAYGQLFKTGSAYTAYKNISANDLGFYNSSISGNISILNDNTSGTIRFAAGGASTAQATLTAAGNLLVGTTTDGGQRLQVSGTSLLNGALSGTTATFNFGNFAGAGARFQYNSSNTPFVINALNNNGSAYIGWNVSAKSSVDTGTYILSQAATKIEGDGGSIRFYNAASGTAGADITFTERMRLDASGNLGIGTTTTTSAFSGSAKVLAILDNNTSNVSSVRVYGGASVTSLELYAAGSQVGLYGSTNHPMIFYTNATERMRLDSSGNLGIGTTTTNSFLNIAAGTTAKAQINLAASTAPTTPNNGDIWFDGTDIKIRVGGVTKTFTLV